MEPEAAQASRLPLRWEDRSLATGHWSQVGPRMGGHLPMVQQPESGGRPTGVRHGTTITEGLMESPVF